MADANIGSLPLAPQVDDDSMLVMEQQGQAMRMTGKQIKDYAKQGLEMNFKEDVDAANEAADRAVSAVFAVTEMTVDAHASDKADVTKSMQSGKVNLSFGLPRGEQGPQGDIGPTGPRGPQGNPGNGLTILGHYDTEEALRAAVTSPEIGDTYSVGLKTPYDTYIFDGVTLDWKNYGPFTGDISKSGVTSFNGRDGDVSPKEGDYTADMVNARPNTWIPTADEVSYNSGTVADAISQLFISGSDAKALISSAVSAKGVPTAADDTWQEMADNIRKIETGSSTGDATATPGDILAGKTAYVATGKVEGIIPSLGPMVYTPGVQAQQIANGQYLSGTQIIQGDTNLTPANIRKGVSIFDVAGAMESTFQATLTVTVDIGAVVTATHTNGTKVEALCTTGKVSLELPIEGQWTVTAQRGVAQYNSVVITVSSQYSASLTAEIHITRYGNATQLSSARYHITGATAGDYAIFVGGIPTTASKDVDAYNSYLVRSIPNKLLDVNAGAWRAAASVGNYALFTQTSENIAVYDSSLVKLSKTVKLSRFREQLTGASIGDYALFGGGSPNLSQDLSTVDAYDSELTYKEAAPLSTATRRAAAASNDSYAYFMGGTQSLVTAYDNDLSRSTPSSLGTSSNYGVAAKAGNYVVFVSEGGDCVAYDMFLTRKNIPEAMSAAKTNMSAGTLNGFAVVAGGYVNYNFPVSGVDAFDAYLTKTKPEVLNTARAYISAATTGNFILFAGGNTSSGASNVVEVYQYV